MKKQATPLYHMTEPEIAAELGMTRKEVKAEIKRALYKLRRTRLRHWR